MEVSHAGRCRVHWTPPQCFGTFLDAFILSWVLAATDAHAKNYSLLLSAGEVRLAPLYDINSVLPSLAAARRGVEPGQISAHTAALAMSIGGRSQPLDIDAAAWKRLAVDCGLPPAATLTRVGELVQAVPAAISAVVASVVASKALTVEQRTFAFDLEQRVLTRTGLCHSALLGRLPPSRRTRAT